MGGETQFLGHAGLRETIPEESGIPPVISRMLVYSANLDCAPAERRRRGARRKVASGARARIVCPRSGQEFLDGEDLDAGVVVVRKVFRGVETWRMLLPHPLGGLAFRG